MTLASHLFHINVQKKLSISLQFSYTSKVIFIVDIALLHLKMREHKNASKCGNGPTDFFIL